MTWELAERGGRTEITVSEDNLPSGEAKAASERAWAMAFDNLRELLAS